MLYAASHLAANRVEPAAISGAAVLPRGLSEMLGVDRLFGAVPTEPLGDGVGVFVKLGLLIIACILAVLIGYFAPSGLGH